MTGELRVRRLQQRPDAVKRAIVDLFAHERPEEEFCFPLDPTEKVWVTVRLGAAPKQTS